MSLLNCGLGYRAWAPGARGWRPCVPEEGGLWSLRHSYEAGGVWLWESLPPGDPTRLSLSSWP